ncbi:hypothetical protein GCM10023310_18220 [Paenibacillus vulneris]|uniref:Uncharacterized protein n=1 Tax=Paenibacillus vulneris TaxID=1133364 RepID=A0ABW3UKF5_9BACL
MALLFSPFCLIVSSVPLYQIVVRSHKRMPHSECEQRNDRDQEVAGILTAAVAISNVLVGVNASQLPMKGHIAARKFGESDYHNH